MHNKYSAFTLVEIMVVVAIIGLLAAMAIPSFIKARNTAQQNACINNLRIIDSAKDQATLTQKWLPGMVTDNTSNMPVINSYIKGSTTPECPAGGAYTYNPIGTNPVCSILIPTSHRLPVDSGG